MHEHEYEYSHCFLLYENPLWGAHFVVSFGGSVCVYIFKADLNSTSTC